MEHLKWTWLDGQQKSYELCCFRPVTVALENFPKGAFYQAKDSGETNRERYGKIEKITWTTAIGWEDDVDEVRFLFVPYPYHFITAMIPEILNISSWEEGLAALVNKFLVLIGLLFATFKVASLDIVKSRLTDWIDPKTKEAAAESEPSAGKYEQQFLELREKIERIDVSLQQLHAVLPAKSEQTLKKDDSPSISNSTVTTRRSKVKQKLRQKRKKSSSNGD